MKVAVVMLTSGGMSGGAAKHLDRVVPLMRSHPHVSDLRVFAPEQIAATEGRDDFSGWPRRDALLGRRHLQCSLRAYEPDVIFVPTARWFRFRGVPSVVMVRNMEPLETPRLGANTRQILTNYARMAAAWRACLNADRIIAVSAYVRAYLMSRWSVPRERIGVVYHGIEAQPPALRPAVLGGVGDMPFLFAAGSIRPARGIEDIIGALQHPDMPADLHVVVAGSHGGSESYFRALTRSVAACGLSNRIHWVGQLNAQEMSWCFRAARAFVMTSRVEACPNIVLEAIRDGALSVSVRSGPMPEIYGDTALYYSAGDVDALAAQVRRALEMPEQERHHWQESAAERALQFSWEATAANTVIELEAAVDVAATRG